MVATMVIEAIVVSLGTEIIVGTLGAEAIFGSRCNNLSRGRWLTMMTSDYIIATVVVDTIVVFVIPLEQWFPNGVSRHPGVSRN
jgi:hypothetical protein